MAAFDTALTPVAVTPNSTSNTSLDPDNTEDAMVYLDITNIGTGATPLVRWGITPNGGSVHWKGYAFALELGNPLELGPYFIQAGDVFTVQTSIADIVTFSAHGLESS